MKKGILVKMEKKQITENGENTTKYGEFITSYFAWLPLSIQKKRVEELQDISKKRKSK